MNKFVALRRYLTLFGWLNILISFPISWFFGDVLLWQPRNLPTEYMLSAIYTAMGVVMVFAARRPEQRKGLVDFLILANLAHALVMAIYAEHAFQWLFDVGFIGLMGLIPLAIYPWGWRQFLRD